MVKEKILELRYDDFCKRVDSSNRFAWGQGEKSDDYRSWNFHLYIFSRGEEYFLGIREENCFTSERNDIEIPIRDEQLDIFAKSYSKKDNYIFIEFLQSQSLYSNIEKLTFTKLNEDRIFIW